VRDLCSHGFDVELAIRDHADNLLTITGATPQPLFVYGSLKRGFRHHGELGGAELERFARTAPRYRLVCVSDYPVLLAGGSEHVSGELYRVGDALLSELDSFEGPSYRRAIVTLEDGSEAIAYLGDAAALAAHAPIDGGEWIE
jgi:gamma-glutamylcyclotransferase (GGCT)/AIG2-like uncharacterized protein YtfP